MLRFLLSKQRVAKTVTPLIYLYGEIDPHRQVVTHPAVQSESVSQLSEQTILCWSAAREGKGPPLGPGWQPLRHSGSRAELTEWIGSRAFGLKEDRTEQVGMCSRERI